MLDVRCWMFDVRCWMFDVGPLFPSAVALAPRPEPGITNPTNYAENKLNSDDAKSRRRKENWRRLLPRITRITRMETDNEQEQEATEETESRAISRKLYQEQPCRDQFVCRSAFIAVVRG